MHKERITNKKLIGELLPVLKEAIKEFNEGNISFTKTDIEGNLYYKRDNTEWIKYTDKYINMYYPYDIFIKVYKKLDDGIFDYAAVDVDISTENLAEPSFRFQKFYRGSGRGFYADIDENGKTINGVWD